MAIRPVPKEPGRYFDDSTGKFIDIVDYRDGDKYDTVRRASGAVAAGTEDQLFRDLSSKDKIDSNIDTSRRISQGEQMLVRRIGCDVPLAVGDVLITSADVKKVLYGGYLNLTLNHREVASGPLYTFPSGYGLAGSGNELTTNGVPSTAAQRQLEKSHWLTSEQDVTCSVKYFDRTWDTGNMATLATRVFVRVFLGGLIRQKR